MCVIGAIKLREEIILFKNRDKLSDESEEIIKTDKSILVQTRKTKTVAAGVNCFGVSFVRAEVVPPEAIAFAYSGKEKEAISLVSTDMHPTKLLLESFDNILNVEEAIRLLKECKTPLRPSLMIIGDLKDIFLLEINGREIISKKVEECVGKANHFDETNYGPIKYQEYPSSFEREQSIRSKIESIKNKEDLIKVLSDHGNKNPDFNVCRHHIMKTISSFIIENRNKKLWYCNNAPCKGRYKEYVLRS